MSAHMRDAVEADLVAHVAALYGPPVGEVHRDERSIWFKTGDDSVHHNGILKSELGTEDVTESVKAFLAPWDGTLPMMWWFFTGPEGLSDAISSALGEQGFVLESDRPSMELALGSFEPPVPAAPVEIRRVSDEGEFRTWSDVVGLAFEAEDHWSSMSTRSFLRLGWDDPAPFRHYLGTLEGRPVGAATLSVGAGVAGLANIATVPDQRRRGFGRAITSEALLDAKKMGLGTAALSADEDGSYLYRSLGFKEIGRHFTFVRR